MARKTERVRGKPVAALEAARLYYLQDKKMDVIARELGVSRSSVSRLLSYAREVGLVDIRINSPLELGGTLERRIHERFGVTAHVVPMPQSVAEVERLERVALTAGRMLGQYVESGMLVGIAWGSTISAVSRELHRKPTRDTMIVQLNGAGNTLSTGVDYSSDILRRFGRAFDAQVQHFPVPAFFDSPLTRDAVWQERSTLRMLDLQAKLDLAVFSLGSPVADVPSRVYVGGYLSKEDYQSLRDDKVVGDIATVFFRSDGSWKDIALNARATGPGIDLLHRVARRFCVVAGVKKLPPLRAALAAGLITDVVLDETLAASLLESEGIAAAPNQRVRTSGVDLAE